MPNEAFLISALTKAEYKTSDSSFSPVIGGGLSRLFAASRTELALAYRSTPSTLNIPARSTFSVNISQPVLANAFGILSRLTTQNATLTRQIALFEIQESYESYLKDLILLYYNWYSLTKQKHIALQSLNVFQQTQKTVKEKYKLGIADLSDLKKTEIQVLDQEDQVKSLENQLQKVRLNLCGALSVTNLNAVVQPAYPNISFTNLNRNFEKSRQDFLSNSRTIQTARKLFKHGQLTKSIAQQGLLPKLDVTADLSWSDSSF